MEAAFAEEEGFSSSRLGRIGESLRRLEDQGKCAGAVSLLVRRGRVVHLEATGFSDLETRRPMDRNGIFRLASMTKPITSLAVMMLFEEGNFLLDDPIAEFLPEFGQAKVFLRESADGVQVAELVRPITIRHLLMHTAGLRPLINRKGETLEVKVHQLASRPLAHQPGDGWTYGHSTDVLGRLIEKISGLPLDRFLHQRIFEPLDMSDTAFDVPPGKYARLAKVYTPNGAGGLRCEEGPNSDLTAPPIPPRAAGNLVSTAPDYARFCQMLLNGGSLGNERILGRKSVELMTSNHTGANRPFPPFPDFPVRNGYGFGLGFRVLIDPTQSGLLGSAGEYGWSGAYGTYFWIDPREQLIGVLMLQLDPGNGRYAWLFQSLAYQALVA
jgi:CubicO group peptidase (beta-lactamase class C family)